MADIISIPKGITKVDNPDHPFTFDGPDYLLFDSKGLLAVFNIRDNEQKKSNKLFARLTNALIAYPAHTKMLLLIDKDKEISNEISQYGKDYFSEFIETKDLKRSKSLIRDSRTENKTKDLRYIQKKIFTIQSQVQRDNLDYIKKSNFNEKQISNLSILKEKAKYFDRISQKDVLARANIYEYQNQIFGVKKLYNNISDLLELQPFYEFVINSEFSVENGIPHFKHISRKALNVNNIPSNKYDPLKPTRVASLFGWHLVNSNDFTQIESRISKFKKMPTPQDRVDTMIALVNSSPSLGSRSKNDIKIEFKQISNVNSISPPARKNILKVLHSTRALDTTLRSFLDYHHMRGKNHSIGQYITLLTNHKLTTLGNLSISEKAKYQNEIVKLRNKHLHTANSYPSSDREVYQLISEMESLITRVISL